MEDAPPGHQGTSSPPSFHLRPGKKSRGNTENDFMEAGVMKQVASVDEDVRKLLAMGCDPKAVEMWEGFDDVLIDVNRLLDVLEELEEEERCCVPSQMPGSERENVGGGDMGGLLNFQIQSGFENPGVSVAVPIMSCGSGDLHNGYPSFVGRSRGEQPSLQELPLSSSSHARIDRLSDDPCEGETLEKKPHFRTLFDLNAVPGSEDTDIEASIMEGGVPG